MTLFIKIIKTWLLWCIKIMLMCLSYIIMMNTSIIDRLIIIFWSTNELIELIFVGLSDYSPWICLIHQRCSLILKLLSQHFTIILIHKLIEYHLIIIVEMSLLGGNWIAYVLIERWRLILNNWLLLLLKLRFEIWIVQILEVFLLVPFNFFFTLFFLEFFLWG